MDLIGTVKDAFDNVHKRRKLYHSTSLVVLDQACEGILETLIQIQLDSNGVVLEHDSVLTELKLKLESSLSPIIQLQESLKEINMIHTKFVKLLEESYYTDISKACISFDFDIKQINKMLVHYFYRQGLFEIGDCLIKEAEDDLNTDVITQKLELNRLIESMKLKNIEPAMKWISTHRQKSSKLELNLISLKYCEMLKEGNIHGALNYVKAHFREYVPLYFQEIEKLASYLLWYGDFENSPYAELLSSSNWDKVTSELTKEYYPILDQSSNSPLAVALSAGFVSLPMFLKVSRAMGLKKEEFQAMKQFPVGVELGKEFQFHSVFASNQS